MVFMDAIMGLQRLLQACKRESLHVEPSPRPSQVWHCSAPLGHQMPITAAHTHFFRSIAVGLSYYHSVVLERKKFGVGNMPHATSGMGWNMNYPYVGACCLVGSG